MAANAEVPPVARKTRKHIGGDDADAEGSAGRSREERQKSVCSSWNTSETRGKYQCEVDNEG